MCSVWCFLCLDVIVKVMGVNLWLMMKHKYTYSDGWHSALTLICCDQMHYSLLFRDVMCLVSQDMVMWYVDHVMATHLPWVHGQGVRTNPLPTWTRVSGLLPFGPGSFRLWAWSWFLPHWLHQDTETGCIFDEPEVMTTSVPSWFLCLVSTILDNAKPQLVHSINIS